VTVRVGVCREGEGEGEGGYIDRGLTVQNREDSAVDARIQHLVAMPGAGKWASLCFSIANDTRNHELGIIKGGAIGMGQRIPKFAALVD